MILAVSNLKPNNSNNKQTQMHTETVLLILNSLLADSTKSFTEALTKRTQVINENERNKLI